MISHRCIRLCRQIITHQVCAYITVALTIAIGNATQDTALATARVGTTTVTYIGER